MKILLQHTQTLHYLRIDKTWTRRDAEAQNFLHSQSATDFAREHSISDAYIAVKFLDGEEIVAPLPELPLPAGRTSFIQTRL